MQFLTINYFFPAGTGEKEIWEDISVPEIIEPDESQEIRTSNPQIKNLIFLASEYILSIVVEFLFLVLLTQRCHGLIMHIFKNLWHLVG